MEVQLFAMKISCFVLCVAKLIISTVCRVADMLYSILEHPNIVAITRDGFM